MATRRLLIAYAHPDDESFGLGALIAKYVNEGVEVYLICATNGGAGSVKPELLEGYTSVAELRLAELDCASEKLGFAGVYKLGYGDSGMMGSDANKDPDCLWHVWHTDPDSVTRRIVEVLREVQPQVIITFNEYGGYGHPDHIAIQQATTAAMEHVDDAAYITGSLPPYQPQKLYYSGIAAFLVRIGVWRTRLKGEDPRKVGTNKDIDLVKILDHVDPATTRVDIHDYHAAWDEANACHASQGGGRSTFLPRWARRLVMRHQDFTRVYPAPTTMRVDESDQFQDVTVDERLLPTPS